MHPFLNWLLTHHKDHRCLTKSPRPWGVSCRIQWPREPAFYVLACDACPDFLQGQGQGRKRPDFLLFLERQEWLLIVVLELTSGVVEPDKRAQLAEGLRTLEGYLDQPGHFSRKIVIRPWILHSGGVRTEDVRRLQQPLSLMGKLQRSVVDRCGRLLGNLLAHWPQER
jgi:hypothetical protein